MVIFELTNTNFLLTLVILFTFQYGDIQIIHLLQADIQPIKFTFQSGDIQITMLYQQYKGFRCNLHSNLVIFEFVNKPIGVISNYIYIPIW